MRRFQCSLVLCFSFLIYDNYALNCRIRHTASKENELMTIYSACQNKQDWKSMDDKQDINKELVNPTSKKTSKIRPDGAKKGQVYDWTTKSKAAENDRATDSVDYDYVTEYVIESSSNGAYDHNNQRAPGNQGEDYGEDLIRYDSYRSLGKRSSKKKRGRKMETTSGQRSQYNPNTINQAAGHERESYGPDTSKKTEDNACALHCFLETLKMTDDTGFPNRYLVMQAITKDIEDVELKEFLQESCEDCFDILSATKDEECEFSRNLLICLSDKGKANCDDWKKDGTDTIGAIKG